MNKGFVFFFPRKVPWIFFFFMKSCVFHQRTPLSYFVNLWALKLFLLSLLFKTIWSCVSFSFHPFQRWIGLRSYWQGDLHDCPLGWLMLTWCSYALWCKVCCSSGWSGTSFRDEETNPLTCSELFRRPTLGKSLCRVFSSQIWNISRHRRRITSHGLLIISFCHPV